MINIALEKGCYFCIKEAAPQQITSPLVFVFGLHSFCLCKHRC